MSFKQFMTSLRQLGLSTEQRKHAIAIQRDLSKRETEIRSGFSPRIVAAHKSGDGDAKAKLMVEMNQTLDEARTKARNQIIDQLRRTSQTQTGRD